MKLLLKQKVFSWFDSYNIYDENENVIYKVKGEFAWGHLLRIYDESDTEVGLLKQNVFTLFPKFTLRIKDKEYLLNNEFTFLKEVFSIDDLDVEVKGDFWGWNYEIKKHDELIARISKKLSYTDVYEINIKNESNSVLVLLIVLSIDALHCDNGGTNG